MAAASPISAISRARRAACSARSIGAAGRAESRCQAAGLGETSSDTQAATADAQTRGLIAYLPMIQPLIRIGEPAFTA